MRSKALADKQEAEAGVGKTLGSLVDDGFEAELSEEDGKRWTSHTAAYDDDFGHLCLSHAKRVLSKFGTKGAGSKNVVCNESSTIILGGWKGMIEVGGDGESRIANIYSLRIYGYNRFYADNGPEVSP
jgi:hypothetical protein